MNTGNLPKIILIGTAAVVVAVVLAKPMAIVASVGAAFYAGRWLWKKYGNE